MGTYICMVYRARARAVTNGKSGPYSFASDLKTLSSLSIGVLISGVECLCYSETKQDVMI